jgi:hypothetical protein
VESTSQALMAYLEADPSDPRAMQAMKWLALNRTAAWSAEQREGLGWKSTKATAQAVYALCAYMKERRETASEMAVTIEVPGQKRDFRIDPDNFWKSQRMEVILEGDAVPDGQFPVTITRTGKGMIFYSVYAEYFTKEEGIKKAGNEIYVERTYEKVVRKAAKAGSDVKEVESFEPVRDGDTVKSGDELRVTLKVKSLNDYEYIVFEDAKPAGMEPVDLQSGSLYAGFCSNMELRDQFVSFFVTHLPQGDHRIEYRCRAEIPGEFHTMPTRGYAMYSPELRTNSDELVVKVKDVEP